MIAPDMKRQDAFIIVDMQTALVEVEPYSREVVIENSHIEDKILYNKLYSQKNFWRDWNERCC
jgi:hypothetical protein